jgi:hypothetical protein
MNMIVCTTSASASAAKEIDTALKPSRERLMDQAARAPVNRGARARSRRARRLGSVRKLRYGQMSVGTAMRVAV